MALQQDKLFKITLCHFENLFLFFQRFVKYIQILKQNDTSINDTEKYFFTDELHKT